MLSGSVLKYLSVGWLQGPRVPADARYPGVLQGTGRRGSRAAGEVGIEDRPLAGGPWEAFPLAGCESRLRMPTTVEEVKEATVLPQGCGSGSFWGLCLENGAILWPRLPGCGWDSWGG